MIDLKALYINKAAESYRAESGAGWRTALWCWRVVGNGEYGMGETLQLADAIGTSRDTVERRAMAYQLFVDLCAISPITRRFVFAARRSSYIYLAHFTNIAKARKAYNLTIEQARDILFDAILAEGDISANSIDQHCRSRYGKERTWNYYADRAARSLYNLLQCPDLPQDVKDVVIPPYERLSS